MELQVALPVVWFSVGSLGALKAADSATPDCPGQHWACHWNEGSGALLCASSFWKRGTEPITEQWWKHQTLCSGMAASELHLKEVGDGCLRIKTLLCR